MNILEKKDYGDNFFIPQAIKKSKRDVSVFFRTEQTESSLLKDFIVALVSHPVLIGGGWLLVKLIVVLLVLLGINLPLFQKPEPKVRDIQFVLVHPSKPTVKRNIPQVKVKKAEDAKPNPIKKTKDSSKHAVEPLKRDVKVPARVKSTNNKPPKSRSLSSAKAKRITSHKSSGSSESVIPEDFSLPMGKIRPLAGSGGTNSDTSSSAVTTTDGAEDGISTGRGKRRTSSFEKNPTKNMISNYDISPYINELQREIKLNWRPPKGQESKRVELFLRIAKDGKLVILNIKRTSEIAEVDNAATSAVKKALPLSPIPAGYKKSYLDVVFSFDYSASTITNRH